MALVMVLQFFEKLLPWLEASELNLDIIAHLQAVDHFSAHLL